MIQIFDTHAHYDDESFDDDRERLLAGFPAQGVHAVTNIGTNIRASEETVRMTEKYECGWYIPIGSCGTGES